MGDPCHRLARAQPQRGGEAEQRRKDREHIDHIADRPPDPFADQRIESRTERKRHVEIIGEDCQREADDGVNCPRMQCPVIDGGGHCHGAGGPGIANRTAQGSSSATGQRRGEMRDGLSNAVEDQPDAHARAKQHGKPRYVGILRACGLSSQPDPAERRDRHGNTEQQHQIADRQQEPVEVRYRRSAQPRKQIRRCLRRDHAEENNRERDQGDGKKHRGVDRQPQPGPVGLAVTGQIDRLCPLVHHVPPGKINDWQPLSVQSIASLKSSARLRHEKCFLSDG